MITIAKSEVEKKNIRVKASRPLVQEKYAICFVHRAYSYFFNVKGLCLPILASSLSGFHVIHQIRNIVFDHISKHQEEKTKRVENTTHTRVF